ncbi:MAG: hypothetical protein IPK19_04695 [Chloroflexi bacterium]|nr:hypothetical protein [Chloroflexota bacterium]
MKSAPDCGGQPPCPGWHGRALLDGAGIVVVGGVGDEIDLLDAVTVYYPGGVVWDMGWEPLSTLERLIDLRGRPLVLALTADRGTAVESAPALLGTGVKGLSCSRPAAQRCARPCTRSPRDGGD